MPHPRAVETRDRKAIASQEKREEERKKKEDAKWVDDDKLLNAKNVRKVSTPIHTWTDVLQNEQINKAEEKAKKKQLLKELEDEETAKLASTSKGSKKQPLVKKLTMAEIDLIRLQRIKKESTPVVDELLEPNINHILRNQRFDDMLSGNLRLEAAGLDEALAVLNEPTIDRNPEKRVKQAYQAYEDKWIKIIRDEVTNLLSINFLVV